MRAVADEWNKEAVEMAKDGSPMAMQTYEHSMRAAEGFRKAAANLERASLGSRFFEEIANAEARVWDGHADRESNGQES